MYPVEVQVSSELRQAHTRTWQTIASAGAFFTGAERVEMVRTARQSQACPLCQARLKALSPNAVSGQHAHEGDLPDPVVDLIHRLRSDPGRLTRATFDTLTEHLPLGAYVEIVSVVASAVIVDTLHSAVGLALPELPAPQAGTPDGAINPAAVDNGACVPVLAGDDTLTDTGMPREPNIARALGLVPGAVALFFNTFRPHYRLKNIALSISQAQAEFVAARVSAMNECFY